MTREERDNAIHCIKKWIEKEPYLQTYKTCLEALEQCQVAAKSERPSYDRNICISNEYNDIGCDECICNTSEGCQREDIEEVIPVENVLCDNIVEELKYKKLCIKGLERDKAMYLEMLKAYEEELQKHMPEEEFTAFATKVAKTSFLAEVMASPNEDFRNTVFENWDDITKD